MQRTYQFGDIFSTRLSRELVERLTKEGQRRRFADGVLFQQQGEDSNGFWLIETGQVKTCRHGSKGELTVFAVFGPGDIFGELAFFAGIARQVDALADGDVDAIWIGALLIKKLLATDPDFSFFLLQSMANQLRIALDRVEEQRNLSAAPRLARALADMVSRGATKVNCTQQELSDLIGVSRVTTGQILARLERAGLIERGYGWISIPNPGLLKDSFG
jgi:CRP/FNR family transcriptional regulator, cyclic AMP receptor protein